MGRTRRIAARLHRGDTVRRLSLAGRRLLPAPEPGTVWTGLQWGRPQQALELQEDDLHAQRAHALDTVLDAVAPVECVLAPPIPRRPWRLAVRSEDGPAVRRALSALPVHWELHREAGGRRLTVRPRLAADGRPLEPVPDLDVVLDVLPFDGARYGDASTAALPHVGAQEWSETSRESLLPQRRGSAAPEPSMPIDVVYTWVDGSDPAWRRRRDEALQAVSGGLSGYHRSAVDESRYLDSEELRYSLRSLRRYANWVRRIHLVTDGQVPHWLDADHPRITVIDHADLLGGSRFNSHAIESALHRIPGLAEHYLYLNDDVFFGRIAYPGDFFPAPGLAAFFPSDLPIDPGPVSAQGLPIMAAAKNGRALLAARFGLDVRTKIRHTVHAQLRSVGEQIEAENPEEVARTREARFRSPTDLSLASSLHHWYAHALGRAVPRQPNYLYLDLASPGVEQSLDALESLRRYDTFCLNQEQTGMSPALRREVGAFLERYLPTPAPWERPA